jgi:hypothetical protein
MNSQQNNAAKPPGQVVNWPLIACLCAILPIELVLHDLRTFGVRSISPRAAGSALLMFLFVGFHPNDNGAPLFCFMIAIILLSIVAKIIAMVRRRRGVICHTRYNGRPYLMKLLPWSETTIKQWEPLIALMSGWFLHRFNHPLGSFVIMGAFCLAVKVGLERVGIRERVLDTSDALVEQTWAMESVRYRSGR